MTNNNNHHSNALAFSRQADTTIEHILASSDPVSAVQRVDTGTLARLPRRHTLNAEKDFGTSRVPAHQPAPQAAEWRIDRRAHKVSSYPSRVLHGTTTGRRTDTAANNHTPGQLQGRGARQHPESTSATQEYPERPLAGVRQDKARLNSAREASPQPAPVTKFTRAQFTNNDVVRSQNSSGARQKLVRVTLWVDPAIKAHVERLAGHEGLTVSAAGAAFLRKALQQDVDLEYSALLQPIIEKAIARQMRALTTRLTWLLVRIAFDAGQTRSLVTNILGRQAGVTQPLLKTILEGSGRSAKANIMRRTPQIATLIESVEQWMLEDEGQDKEKHV